jgi:hypothetical protein
MNARRSPSALISLERRILMHVDPNDPTHHDELPDDLGVYPVITAGTTTGDGSTTPAASTVPLSSVPALSSRPAATAKLYLDFTGDTTNIWGSYRPGTTPAYDTDGDPTTFSDAELTSIREIFNRVAEKYSPFNIDVTTTNPGNLTNKKTQKVVIGGDGAWLGAQAGGVSYIGAFYNSSPNVSFVFPKMLANGYAKYVAEAAAHESGHAFGLQHQGTYDASGNLTEEYRTANAAGDAPIMGNSYTARRGLWWNGTASDAYGHMQDDLAVISSTNDGFGYRADDFANDIAPASTLTLSGTAASGAGVIENTADADVFSFVTGTGAVNLFADPYSVGGMLDLRMTLRDSSGNVVASADTTNLGESLSANLAAGTYYLAIASHGSYGDIGQYSIHGSVAPVVLQPPAPTAPSGLVATTISNSAIRLAWTDNSTGETGFKVYSSTDQQNWTLLATPSADATNYDATGLHRNTQYYYVVRAYNTTGESANTNTASAKTDPGIKGDANLDGVVDFADLVILSQNYNTTTGAGTWSTGDFTGDGNVDFNDLTLLSQNYNTADATFATDTAAVAATATASATTVKSKPAAKPQPVFKPASRAAKALFSTAAIRRA